MKRMKQKYKYRGGLLIPEVNEMCATSVPKKSREDTEYCMRIWNAWWKEKITRNETWDEVAAKDDKQIMPLLQMNKEVMKHWLTLFILEVRTQNRMEYPTNTLHHIVCDIMRYLWHNGIHVDFFKIQFLLKFGCRDETTKMNRLGITKSKQNH